MAKKKQIELTIEEKLQNALVPKEEQPYKIPNNWCWVRLGNITQIKGGKRIPKGTSLLKENTGYKYIRVTDMKNGTVLNDDIHYISKDIYNKISNYTISKNDIYITCAGTIGRVGIIPVEFDGANLTENADKIIIKHINKNLLVKVLSSYIVQKQIQEVITTGCQPKLAIKKIEQLKIPLPPINEQQRIVERIESLFVKLDRAKELIENTLAQFEQNKMAILHKAFTGELTAKWRKEKGILKDTWKSMALENCGTWSGGGTPSMSCGDYWENGNIPWITSKDMKNIYIEKTQKYITEKGVECSSAKYIDKPAILFVTRSGILRRIFPVCMVKIPFTVNQDLKVLVPSKMVCLEYLYWICIYKSNKILGTCMKSGTTVESISTDKLKKFKITVPTIEEQQEIVNILDKLLAKYNKIKNLEQQLEKIELLKKAILAKAFRGELGTNNPDEESAENLLKEILAEK
ncbi:Type I restriction enzyme EcoKI specificity protein [Megamonas hypermegale]|uniref:Type I restriction enzyme EcoKI specificity protein n=1 Tax=Megamonas hypermegale TaxID=158847 RepID=A0A378NTD4_9FIRM|nr:restriction endonuclease subunit S [Megamonas hypermegale]STY71631.1 Type I restriction enzyme EcoKI specificity protein [Megamonas hypermegale]